MPLIKSIAAPVRFEIERIKASRFIANAYPIRSREDVEGHVAALHAEFPKANHHCYAYRLTERDYRSNDDGEPSGSAGIPILKPIEGQGLVRTLVVVTRVFGGTKLGVGGLVHAYGDACREVLSRCEITELPTLTRYLLHHQYHQSGDVEACLRAYQGEVVASDYGAAVVTQCTVPEDAASDFEKALTERTSAQVRIELMKEDA